MVTTLSIRCDDCGANLKGYEVYDIDTGEVLGIEPVCPNDWMGDHP